jgi:hypothetical protein
MIVDRAIGCIPREFSLFPQQHKGGVRCYARKPRSETRFVFKGVKVNKGLQQRFLEHIFCVLPIVCNPIDPMQYASGVALAEFSKGRGIS